MSSGRRQDGASHQTGGMDAAGRRKREAAKAQRGAGAERAAHGSERAGRTAMHERVVHVVSNMWYREHYGRQVETEGE